MMKIRIGRWIIVVTLLVAMLLVAGCQSAGDQPDSNGQGAESAEVNTDSGNDADEGSGNRQK